MPPLGIHRILDSFDRRLHRLENRRPQPIPEPDDHHEIVFSFSGEVEAGISPPWTPRSTARVYKVTGLLTTPGSTGTTVHVRESGQARTSLTISAGNDFEEIDADWFIFRGAHMTVSVEAVGSGSYDLTVIVYYYFEESQGSS